MSACRENIEKLIPPSIFVAPKGNGKPGVVFKSVAEKNVVFFIVCIRARLGLELARALRGRGGAVKGMPLGFRLGWISN